MFGAHEMFENYLFAIYFLLAIGLFIALIGAWIDDLTDVGNPDVTDPRDPRLKP